MVQGHTQTYSIQRPLFTIVVSHYIYCFGALVHPRRRLLNFTGFFSNDLGAVAGVSGGGAVVMMEVVGGEEN